jgi:hypothetical protein
MKKPFLDYRLMQTVIEKWPTQPAARLLSIIRLQTGLPIRSVANLVGLAPASYKGEIEGPPPRIPLNFLRQLKDMSLKPSHKWLMVYLATTIDSNGISTFVPEAVETLCLVPKGTSVELQRKWDALLEAKALFGQPDMYTGRRPAAKLQFKLASLLEGQGA